MDLKKKTGTTVECARLGFILVYFVWFTRLNIEHLFKCRDQFENYKLLKSILP